MKNPTMKLFAVVSIIVLLFGGMSVFLAIKYKDTQKANEALSVEVEALQEQLKDCQ